MKRPNLDKMTDAEVNDHFAWLEGLKGIDWADADDWRDDIDDQSWGFPSDPED